MDLKGRATEKIDHRWDESVPIEGLSSDLISWVVSNKAGGLSVTCESIEGSRIFRRTATPEAHKHRFHTIAISKLTGIDVTANNN